ncbi:hypothetical protein Emed_001026 [Eimeria media]
MKGFSKCFLSVVGLTLCARGATATFVARRQLRHAFRAGETVHPNLNEAFFERQASVAAHHAVLSPEPFAEGEGISERYGGAAVWTPTEANDSSFVQLQSEAEEEDTSETEDGDNKETSSSEAHADHKASGSEESVTPSESEKHSGEESKEEGHTHVSSKETKESDSKEPAGEDTTDEEEKEKAQSNHEEESKTSSSSDKETHEHAHDKKSTEGHNHHHHHESSKEGEEPSLEGEGNLDPHFDAVLSRLRVLLKASAGKKLLTRLTTMIDLHEKEEEAEKALKREAQKLEEKKEEEKTSEVIAPDKDLLLSQQLNNMWVLPLHDEEKRQTCLSGFEKLTHEATITCSDPECFKLETKAKECPYMSIISIMRKEDLKDDKTAKETKTEKLNHKDHMLLGFNGECQKPETLGKEILSILQRPKAMAKRHALERTTGTSSIVPLQKHHLDLVCDPDDKTEYPSCKTVYEALNHFAEPHPRALPELMVLTDIGDLKNTLGLYRLTFLFEGLVQFAAPDGTRIDASKHKLTTEDAEFIQKHRHQDVTTTVLLKEN